MNAALCILRRDARIMLASCRVQVRATSWPMLIVSGVAQPVVLTAIVFMADRSGRLGAQQVVLGSALLAVWATTLWQAGLVLQRESWAGTLSAICSRPAGLGPVLIGKATAASGVATVAIIISTLSTSTVLGRSFPIADPFVFMAALLLGFVTTVPLGLLVACLFLLTRAAVRIAEVLMFPVYIAGGMIVPPEFLPSALRELSALISLHWAGVAMTGAALGQPVSSGTWAALVATGAGYAVAAGLAFRRVMRRARQEASLEIF